MNDLPMMPLSPEEQQRLSGQLYALMAKQVKSYHKHHHMGENSSVSVELAQEMMESIEYTVNQVGGMGAFPTLEETLRVGQNVLEEKMERAKAMLELVAGTAPRWQTECRWDAIDCLRRYLAAYDHLHLAHKAPDDLFYPILISPPEGIRGIDSCLFFLQILWVENQIMAGVPEAVLDRLWDRLPAAALNQCEHLLINGMGKALLGTGLDPLTFAPEERLQIVCAMLTATEEKLRSAAEALCRRLDLQDEHAKRYVQAILPQLRMWTGENAPNGNVEHLFV